MADEETILLAFQKGAITQEEAKAKLLQLQQSVDTLPDPGSQRQPQERRQPIGAIEAAQKAARRAVGPAVGLDPQSREGVKGALDFLPDPIRDIGVALAETGAQLGDVIAGGTMGGASLLGDALAGITGSSPEQARRMFLSMAETSSKGRPTFKARIPARPASQAARARPAQQIIEAGKREGVPVLTTDVIPPRTAPGKLAQVTAEKIPFVGTAPVRAAQQEARVGSVENLIKEFDIGLDTPLEQQIIAGLSKTKKANIERAANIRGQAVGTLKQFGNVETGNSSRAIAAQIEKQKTFGRRANNDLISLLKNTDAALNGDFEQIKNIRTLVIQDIKALQKGEHIVLKSADEAALEAVKKAIDKDLLTFAKTHDRNAASQWMQSNRLFADEFTKFKGSELKRILAKGDITPEVIGPVLRGGKVSELNRLANNAGKEGRGAARAAIIRDAINRAGGFENLSPDRIVNELLKPNTQKAIGAFFRGEDKKRLDGFIKLLNATRQAQIAPVITASGQQVIPFAALGAGAVAPTTTFLTALSIGGAGRAYEGKAMRDFLLRAANTPKDTRQFQELVSNFQASMQEAVAFTQAQQTVERQE